MLTTRNTSIASYVDANSSPYELKFMEREKSWELFCRKAFPSSTFPRHLEQRFKLEIIQKCCRLPLSVITLAGQLRRQESHIEWIKVLDQNTSEFRQWQDKIQKTLSLSYDDLPYHLKSCFLYFAALQEGSTIDAEKLKRLWIAEGFIRKRDEQTTEEVSHERLTMEQTTDEISQVRLTMEQTTGEVSHERLIMEDVAEKYLMELSIRNMVQLTKQYGGASSVSIHKLMLDLAHSKATKVSFLDILDSTNIDLLPPTLRRLSVLNGINNDITLLFPKLRTLLSICPSNSDFSMEPTVHGMLGSKSMSAPFGMLVFTFLINQGLLTLSDSHSFSRVKFLRVIDLEGLPIKSLPTGFSEMTQLRYLGLRSTCLKELPAFVMNLRKLLTLDISDTEINMQIMIAIVFWRIPTLRHVLLSGHRSCRPRVNMRRLDDLQTLKQVPCGSWVRKGCLERMKNLRHLEMNRISAHEEDALSDALGNLAKLATLELEGSLLPAFEFIFYNHPNLQVVKLKGPLKHQAQLASRVSHQLLPKLTTLTLELSGLGQDDLKTLAELPSLASFELKNRSYLESTLITPAGGFPSLEFLKLDTLSDLEEWIIEEHALPCLVDLHLVRCPRLEIPAALQQAITLQKLRLHANEMTGLP